MIPLVKVSLIYFPYFSAMDTTNVQIKKQVFELLSALCVYSAEGYKRALEALEHYKTFRSERYRFKLIVDEVREAKSTEYQIVLLAFVNCLVISTPLPRVRNYIWIINAGLAKTQCRVQGVQKRVTKVKNLYK